MAVGVVTALIFLAVLTGCGLLWRALHRANRVVAGRRSPAPLGWLWSWRRAARMHRRLRRAVQNADAAIAPLTATVTPLHDVAADLSGRAAVVDDRLVAASRLPAYAGRPQLTALAVQVRDLEGTAQRLRQLSSQWQLSLDRAVAATTVAPPDLAERLDAVEAALLELPTGA